MLMYNIEDTFIERKVKQEAEYLISDYEKTGKWPAPRETNMQLHFSRHNFPSDFRELAIKEPMRKEFFGQDGRHYHVYQFPEYPNTFLVAEVSNELIVRHIRDGVLEFLLVSSLIVTLLACLIAWWIARKTTKPLDRLATFVETVSPENMKKRFANEYPRNEVGILAQKLEDTLLRIQKVLEREKAFTRDASHELRTPLAVIKNTVELAQNQKGSADTELLARIYKGAEQMEQTVKTLLILARNESEFNNSQPIDLMPIIEQSIIDNHLLLENKAVEIDIDESCCKKIQGQKDILKLILDNLLSNAFKYTDKGEVCIYFENDHLHIKDSGTGIDNSISNDITQVGVKSEQSTGFGFGLAIVKRLCEHQGWQLQIENSASQQGTVVSVRFSSLKKNAYVSIRVGS